MLVVKQFLKLLLLPPGLWLLALCAVFVFWRRSWARLLLLFSIVFIAALHSGIAARGIGYYLESRYPPVRDCRSVGSYDAIVVLTGGVTPPGGLVPRPQIDVSMFRRLDEALRLYRQVRKPIVVSGGHVDPFTPAQGENQAACDTLARWGVPPADIVPEPRSRDTFESAEQVRVILRGRGWRRYLLVTSALHMPRSMFIFSAIAPEPVAAPGDFVVAPIPLSPLALFPSESAARDTYAALHEYVGLLNYRVRVWLRR